MTYSEKLKDPRWQKKRLEILQRDEFRCQLCWDNESELHIHHKKYFNGLDPWDYPNMMMITLCSSCHGMLKTNYDIPKNESNKFEFYPYGK